MHIFKSTSFTSQLHFSNSLEFTSGIHFFKMKMVINSDENERKSMSGV